MPCIISDVSMNIAPDNTAIPLSGLTVLVQPSEIPVFMQVLAEFREIVNPQRAVLTDNTGAWSVTLPWPSETDPQSTKWHITTPDLIVWEGAVPEGEAGPLTLHELITDHGWLQVIP